MPSKKPAPVDPEIEILEKADAADHAAHEQAEQASIDDKAAHAHMAHVKLTRQEAASPPEQQVFPMFERPKVEIF